MPTDPRVDAYIARQADFAQPILAWLRARIHASCPEIEETIKWGRPAFYYKGRPLAGVAAFKAHAGFGFWDPDAVATGKEAEGSDPFGRIESLADLPDAAAFEALVRNAAALIDAGQKPRWIAARKSKGEPDVPPEIAEALAGDDLAAETFNNFPPSCRREYCEWVSEAKRPETRARRLAETIEWLREGKRRNWKYETC